MQRERLTQTLATLFVVALLTACSGQTEAAEDPLSYAGIESLMREQFEFREEWTASCMADEGFDYFPTAFSTDGRASTAPGGTDTSNRLYDFDYEVEHASAHGFGIVENSLEPSGAVDAAREEDPNQAYRQSLDHDAALAYQRALEGEDGCSAQGEVAATEEFAEQFASIDDAASRISTRITNDERFVEMDRRWQECMADRGWDAESIVGFEEVVSDEIFSRLDGPTLDPEQGPQGPDPELVDELFTFERRAATDHAECWQEHSGEYDEVLRDAYAAVVE